MAVEGREAKLLCVLNTLDRTARALHLPKAEELAAIVMAQIMNVFVCRHPSMSVFQLKISGNPLLWLGIAVEMILILLVVYTPWGNALFGTQPLGLSVWGLMIVLALCFGSLEELRKWIVRRNKH